LNRRQKKSDQQTGSGEHHNQFDQREPGGLAYVFVTCFHIFIAPYLFNLFKIQKTVSGGLPNS
jgi:hypothetical protein